MRSTGCCDQPHSHNRSLLRFKYMTVEFIAIIITLELVTLLQYTHTDTLYFSTIYLNENMTHYAVKYAAKY